MAQPNIKAVCFDMDGLLFNTEELYDEMGVEMLQRRGKEIDHELVRRMMGLQADAALKLFIEHYQLTDTPQQLMREGDEFFDRVLSTRLAPMPGAVELLDTLTSDGTRPLALTTSSGKASVERIMAIFDFRHHFEFLLTAEDIEQGKPHPEIYMTAAAKFSIEPSEMLVFEDSENGCKSGVAAGAHVIAIPSKPTHDYSGSLFIADTLEDARIKELII